MSKAFSRRDFLKATAAAALAVSLSGALTGCGEDAQPAENEAVLGDFKIKLTNAVTEENSTTGGGTSKSEYRVKLKAEITCGDYYKMPSEKIFTASVRDKKWTLEQPTGNFEIGNELTNKIPTKTKTELSIKAPDDAAWEIFKKGEALKLKIAVMDQSVVFYLRNVEKDKSVTIKKS